MAATANHGDLRRGGITSLPGGRCNRTGFFEARDLKLREQLGLTVDPEKEFRHRDAEKQGLKKAFEREGLNASAASVHLFIVRTP
jgi:hypothetical protein